MQKKFFIFVSLFLECLPCVPFVNAMPPKPMLAGHEEEGQKKEENPSKLSSELITAQNRRNADLQDKMEQEEEDEEVNLSDEELDEILGEAKKAQEYWENTHIDETTSPTAVQELSTRLEEEEAAWEKKQEQLNLLAEKMEAPEKLELAINACKTTLDIIREQEDELMRRSGSSYIAESLISKIVQQDVGITPGIAAVSLAGKNHSLFEERSIFFNNSLEQKSRIAILKEQASSLRKYAQERGDRAHREHRQARDSFFRGFLTQAEDYYQDAISSAKKTAHAWEKSEQAHLELMEALSQKIRQWGQRLKLVWSQRAQVWQQEYNKLFEAIEAKKKEALQKNQKTIELQQRIDEVSIRKQQAIEKRNQADQEERNEIGATWDSIARKLEVIEKHLQKTNQACQQGDNVTVKSFEEKILALERRIADETQHLNFLIEAIATWRRDYKTEASRYLETREVQPDGRKIVSSIVKKHFIGPLLRIEKVFDRDGELIEEMKMAAEHLMVKLESREKEDLFIQEVKKQFPENDIKMEDVFPQDALYRVCFQPSASDPNPQKLLDLFDNIKNFIDENQLGGKCYPDLFSTLSSSKEDPLKKK